MRNKTNRRERKQTKLFLPMIRVLVVTEGVEGEGECDESLESPIQFVQAGEDPGAKLLKRRNNLSASLRFLDNSFSYGA